MTLGTLGCGKMGTTLIGGALRAGLVTPDEVLGCDPLAPARDAFTAAAAGPIAGRDAMTITALDWAAQRAARP